MNDKLFGFVREGIHQTVRYSSKERGTLKRLPVPSWEFSTNLDSQASNSANRKQLISSLTDGFLLNIMMVRGADPKPNIFNGPVFVGHITGIFFQPSKYRHADSPLFSSVQ